MSKQSLTFKNLLFHALYSSQNKEELKTCVSHHSNSNIHNNGLTKDITVIA